MGLCIQADLEETRYAHLLVTPADSNAYSETNGYSNSGGNGASGNAPLMNTAAAAVTAAQQQKNAQLLQQQRQAEADREIDAVLGGTPRRLFTTLQRFTVGKSAATAAAANRNAASSGTITYRSS